MAKDVSNVMKDDCSGVTGPIMQPDPIQKEHDMTRNCNAQTLLLAIFQAAHPIVNTRTGDPVSAAKFLQHCAPDIARIGRIFKFLGLAEESPESAFGWEPTDQLMHLVAERAARSTKASKKRATAKERKLVEMLIQVAGGETEEIHFTDDFLFSVLNALGLLRDARGGCKPTSLLRETVEGIFAM